MMADKLLDCYKKLFQSVRVVLYFCDTVPSTAEPGKIASECDLRTSRRTTESIYFVKHVKARLLLFNSLQLSHRFDVCYLELMCYAPLVGVLLRSVVAGKYRRSPQRVWEAHTVQLHTNTNISTARLAL